MAERSGADALRDAVAAVAAGRWTREEALLDLHEGDLDDVLHPRFDETGGRLLATGVGASPGAAVGRVYVTAAGCLDAWDRHETVILVRTETSPDDEPAFQIAAGVVTARGGLASHAAVVARGRGLPAVVGADAIVVGEHGFTAGDVVVGEGDVVSIDGTTGEVLLGERALVEVGPTPELATVLAWADEVRAGRVGVRANADTANDVALAVSFGAEGVGLCRTEHMFLAADRLPVVRAVLLAVDAAAEAAALDQLLRAQREDFVAILRAVGDRPLTVRLLDPPLHEFLPADVPQEQNPMLGTRGVRLAALQPGLYEVQVRALAEAALAERAAGRSTALALMIPLTVNGAELRRARGWVEAAIASVPGAGALGITIGTMIETPRAALVAGELAEVADFFSFGTNDLTQMTFGFSRDDVEARLVPEYLAAGILPANPFQTLDPDGVGALVALAIERGRTARPDLEVGVCGEHGGDPASIAQLCRLPIDYVSCSPYRVPIARLAVAQALLRG